MAQVFDFSLLGEGEKILKEALSKPGAVPIVFDGDIGFLFLDMWQYLEKINAPEGFKAGLKKKVGDREPSMILFDVRGVLPAPKLVLQFPQLVALMSKVEGDVMIIVDYVSGADDDGEPINQFFFYDVYSAKCNVRRDHHTEKKGKN